MGQNSNVVQINPAEVRYRTRIMHLSGNGGVVKENRAEHFLILNVSPMDGERRLGCATIVFEGDDATDLPTPAEITTMDLDIVGTWGRHAVHGNRFDVLAWNPVARPEPEPPKPKGKTRRLGNAPTPAPVKRKTRRLAPPPPNPKAAQKRTRAAKPSRGAVASTNDWYSQTNGQGDSLDFMDG